MLSRLTVQKWVAVIAAKCAFCEADMRRAHASDRPSRADCRVERVSESDSANCMRERGMLCMILPYFAARIAFKG